MLDQKGGQTNERKAVMSKAIIVLVMSSVAAISHAASFDCAKASTGAEKLVCLSPRVSKLDEDMAGLYKQAKRIDPSIVASQKDWISIRNSCGDEACMVDSYQTRNFELQEVVSGDAVVGSGGVLFLNKIDEPNSRVGSFNADLKQRKLGIVTSCSLLVDVPLGPSGDSNHSYGGVCLFKAQAKESSVMVCNDDMVGNFAMKEIHSAKPTMRVLGQFVANNCSGG